MEKLKRPSQPESQEKSFKRVLTEAIESGQLTTTTSPSEKASKQNTQSTEEAISTVGARLPEISNFYGRANAL